MLPAGPYLGLKVFGLLPIIVVMLMFLQVLIPVGTESIKMAAPTVSVNKIGELAMKSDMKLEASQIANVASHTMKFLAHYPFKLLRVS